MGLMENHEAAVDADAIAALLNVHRDTVYAHARTGQLPAFKVGSRWRFFPSAVISRLNRPRDPWDNPRARHRRSASR